MEPSCSTRLGPAFGRTILDGTGLVPAWVVGEAAREAAAVPCHHQLAAVRASLSDMRGALRLKGTCSNEQSEVNNDSVMATIANTDDDLWILRGSNRQNGVNSRHLLSRPGLPPTPPPLQDPPVHR